MEHLVSTLSCLVIRSPECDAEPNCFEELFVPAITAAGLSVTGLDPKVNDASVASLTKTIKTADVCLADLTGDDPATWMAFGCSLALEKPICIVANQTAAKRSAVRLIQGVISYPHHPPPGDREALQNRITAKLLHLKPAEQAGADRAVDGWKAESNGIFKPATSLDPIKFYEHLALKILSTSPSGGGMGLKQLAHDMNQYGLIQATSIAVSSLRRHKFIQPAAAAGHADNISAAFVVTDAGRQWLKLHSKSAELPPIPPDPGQLDMVDLVHEL